MGIEVPFQNDRGPGKGKKKSPRFEVGAFWGRMKIGLLKNHFPNNFDGKFIVF
jgi:hypothetical protein